MTSASDISRAGWMARALASSQTWLLAVRASPAKLLVVLATLGLAATTEGLFTSQNLTSVLGIAALVGCVAIGMSFVTFGGHIMSFALGATLGVASIVCAALSGYGLAVAIAGALLVGVLMNALQGFLIGYFGANALIVTIAAAALAGGASEFATSGQTVYATGTALSVLRARPLGIPLSLIVFICALPIAHLILTRTRLGRRIFMLGSNARAANAAGVDIPVVTTVAFAIGGLFASCAGILVAGRYGAGTFEYGADYDYRAIAAVLVGGNVVTGGEGSVWRTALGVLLIALISNVLLLRGYSSQMQLFAAGLIVLLAILLQGQWKR